MIQHPERFALFSGQDILLPATVAARISAVEVGESARESVAAMREALADPAAAKPTLNANAPILGLSARDFTWLANEIDESVPRSTLEFRDEVYGAALVEQEDHRPEGAVAVPVRTLALSFVSDISRFALLAKAHAQWASVSRFCGACGSPLVDANGHREVEEPLDDHAHGARFCPRCKRLYFPRMSPAVIVLVRKGAAILLGHNVRFPGKRHSLLAGFVEIGETIEEAAAREIREEASIEIKNLRYLKSQPWPFPDSLMLGFTAEWASGEARPDGAELDHLGWYTVEDLPEMPMKGSIARSIIDAFISGGLSNP